jgi:hypothetical protein
LSFAFTQEAEPTFAAASIACHLVGAARRIAGWTFDPTFGTSGSDGSLATLAIDRFNASLIC